jgi:hypothetical protein
MGGVVGNGLVGWDGRVLIEWDGWDGRAGFARALCMGGWEGREKREMGIVRWGWGNEKELMLCAVCGLGLM